MRPFKFTGVSACNGKTAAPVLLNDTYTDELHMDGKDAYATLATNEPGEEDGGRRVYWTTSDKTVPPWTKTARSAPAPAAGMHDHGHAGRRHRA